MTEHAWDEATNSCKHCDATPWAINEGYRAIECNPGPTLTGLTHRLKKRPEHRVERRVWFPEGRIVVEAFLSPESE